MRWFVGSLWLLSGVHALAPFTQTWVSHGPYGGSFHSFVFHPQKEEVVFASELDGLFRSTDTGKTWKRLQIPGGEFTVRIHPQKPQSILAASPVRGIFQSTDLGETWIRIYQYPFQGDGFYDLEFDPVNPNVLYGVSFYHGVWKSYDHGKNWIQKSNGLSLKPVTDCCIDIPQLEIDPSNRKILYTLLPGRMIFKTENGAESWKRLTGPKFSKEVHALVIDPRNTLVLYAGGAEGVFRTINGGIQWSSRNCGCYIWNITLNPFHAKEVYGVGEGAVRSEDGGKTWQWFTPHPFLSGILLSVAVHPKHPGIVLVGGFGGGIFRSTDSGHSWETVNEILDSLPVTQLVMHPGEGNHLYALGGQQLFVSRDGARSWNLFLKAESSRFWVSDITFHPRNPRILAVAGYRKQNNGALRLSTDGGQTWNYKSPYPGVTYGCSRCVAFDAENNNVLYMTVLQKGKDKMEPAGIARSTDLGGSWRLINSGLTSKDVWVIFATPRGLYAGTGTGLIFRSRDSGNNWTNISKGLDGSSIRSILQDPYRPDILYVVTYSSFYKSEDAGQNWIRKTKGLPNAWYNNVYASNGKLYLTGQPGIFESEDNGETWKRSQQYPYDETPVYSLIATGDPLFIGTERGVFFRQE